MQDFSPRPSRPLGVVLLSLADAFFAGLTPVFATLLWVLHSKPTQGGWGALLSAGLGAMIVFAALGTFSGHDRARSALLYLLILYYSLQSFGQVVLAVTTASPEVQLPAAGKVLSMGVYLLLNLWYFLRPETLAFYRHPIEGAHRER